MNSENDLLVSIICNTFNHGQYIEETIKGFLFQKTSFKIEVLIHDDASQDDTPSIIRKYQANYPDIIKPIYQNENQYSKGINVTNTYQLPRVKGKYIAFCEGDDYWTDPLKLQKQVDYLEDNKEVDICTHCVKKVNEVTGKVSYISPTNISRILSASEVIQGGGGYIGTNSIVYRTELIHDFPKFRMMLPLDYTMQVHGALRGGMYYFSENMSTYRFMTSYSWTKNNRKNAEKAKAADKKWIQMLEQLNIDTSHMYDREIRSLLLTDGVSILNSSKENREILFREKEAFKELSLTRKIKVLLIAYFPGLVSFLKCIRKK